MKTKRKTPFRKALSVLMAFVLVLVFTGLDKGFVSHAEGGLSVSLTVADGITSNVNVSYTFLEAGGQSCPNGNGVVNSNGSSGTFNGSESIPTGDNGATQLQINVQTAGNTIADTSFITKNGTEVATGSGVVGTFSVTSNDVIVVSVSLTPSNNGGNNGGNNNQPTGNQLSLTLDPTGTGTDLIGVIKVSVTGDDSQMWTFGDDGQGNTVWTRDINKIDGSYTVQVEGAPNARVISATIGGQAATLSSGRAVRTDVTFTGASATLAISVNIAVNNDFTNILWGYDAQATADDAYVDPRTGTIEIDTIKRNGATLFQYGTTNMPDNPDPNHPGKLYENNDGTLTVSYETAGSVITSWYVACMRGDVITFKFIPEPGYQLKSASINNYTLAPQATQCTYQVTMAGLLHINGAFQKTNAQTSVSQSANVTSFTVNADQAVDCGNVAATVTGGQANPADNALEAAMGTDAADFHEAVETVDISMTNIISKGGSGTYFNNASNYWTNSMSDLSAPVTISLDVPNNLADGETYSIVRNHNGTLQELNATYNATTGKLTFESDKFSEYTIIKKAGTPVTTSSDSGSSSSDSSSSGSGSSGSGASADPEGTVTLSESIIGETTLPAEEVEELGITFAPVVNAPTETIYSVYNPYTGEIVYTPNAAEKNALVSSGWTDQGILWDTSKDPTVAAPVYRLYNPVTGEHFYTINQAEVIACAQAGFTFEGSAFHVPLKGKLIPVYRMYCSKVTAGAHRFVEDEVEVARLEATGNWIKEGIAWYTISR